MIKLKLVALQDEWERVLPLPDKASPDEVLVVESLVLRVLRSFLVSPCDEWPLSARALNILRRLGCKTVFDLGQVPSETLARMKNCGQKTMLEVATIGEMHGFNLPNWWRACGELGRAYREAYRSKL